MKSFMLLTTLVCVSPALATDYTLSPIDDTPFTVAEGSPVEVTFDASGVEAGFYNAVGASVN